MVVVVSAPISGSPWIGAWTVNGARLAADELNRAGGVVMGGAKRRVRIEALDHRNSAATAVANARRAVSLGAAALITDGVGVLAMAGVTDAAHLPVFVTYDGSREIIDAAAHPTLYRMAPANRPMANRLADYLSARRPRIAVLHDDNAYGRDGAASLHDAVRRDDIPAVATIEVPAGAASLAPQVLRARRSGADTVILWAGAPTVASAVRAIRSADWRVPIYGGPPLEDPLVRQQLAQHPEWVDGLTFVSFRITAEVGIEPFQRFRTAYEKHFGADDIGVAASGRPVIQPPDWATYPYDAVHLVAAALTRAGGAGPQLIEALHTVSVTGANGDERNYTATNHEGVSSDDMYFARFA
ncbi:MAG: ABC transporter substrate-binding protein, partial [Mycobacteriales bacterium]